MDERPPKRSLADDADFFASLGDLDRGLTDRDPAPTSNVQPFPQPPAPVSTPASRTGTPRSPVAPAAPPSPGATAAIALPETPAWVPPSAVAAINAAAVALATAFDLSPAPAPRASAPPQPGTAASPRPLLDLFPPLRQATAPSLSLPQTAPRPGTEGERQRAAARPQSAFPAAAGARSATYETFYGLHEKPFAATPDLRFLYHSNAHDRALQDLLSSVGRHDAVTILTGERGIGKTTLCQALVEQLDRRTMVAFPAGPLSSAEDFLKTLLVDFGVVSADEAAAGRLAGASRDDLAAALRDFVGSLAVLQASALLVVDDAQALPAAVLRELSFLADVAASGHLLQIVLAGEPQLTRQLRSDDLRGIDERVTLRVELDPLEEGEVPGYVAHRLAVAGRGERVEFGEAALRRIFELSDGVPETVNRICERSLALGYRSSASRIDADLVDDAAEGIGLASFEAGSSWHDRLMLAVLMIALMLAGAAAAGWVFREPLKRTWTAWHGGDPFSSPTAR